ncbi:MAG: Hsp20/alpha crystallin family protein [Candidatus Paceibacterota bacterium]
MAKDKKSFFERLTGVGGSDEYENEEVEEKPRLVKASPLSEKRSINNPSVHQTSNWMDEDSEEGQLTVDVFQTPEHIIIKTLTAGVRPEDLDISITRDMVTIKGSREESREINDEDYFHKELYWGSFSRTILLPQEVDVEGAEANEKHGLLVLKLPKLNKNKETKIKVKSSS